MDYRTEALHVAPQLSIAVMWGSGFTPQEYRTGISYMHRHRGQEINYCLQGSAHDGFRITSRDGESFRRKFPKSGFKRPPEMNIK